MLDKAELLLPAGSLVKLKTAILYGADAVYAGTPDMSLRTQSKFSLEDLQEGIRFVHNHGKKIVVRVQNRSAKSFFSIKKIIHIFFAFKFIYA